MDIQEANQMLMEKRGEDQKASQENNIKEQIQTKSPGHTIVECLKHGKYEARVFESEWTEKPIIMSCPKCIEEKRLKEEKEETERKERERLKVQRDRLYKSGIPLRFKNKKLSDLQFTTQPQRKIINVVNQYLKAVLSGKSTSLILCGKPGTGKTHIGCSLVRDIIENEKNARIITTANLMRKVKETYRKDFEYSEDDIYAFYGFLDLLVIDEVGVQFGSDTEKLIFYEIINQRYNNMRPTILISNLTSDELSGFIGERAYDRFKEDGGAILAFDWESYRK